MACDSQPEMVTKKKMTPDLAQMILKEIGLPAEYSWVDDQRYEAAQYALECMDDLRRFWEREPLVEKMLDIVAVNGHFDDDCDGCIAERSACEAVREFKISE